MALKSQENNQLNLRTVSLGELTWVDIAQPTEETAKYLAEHYNFHPMDLEDSLSTRQLSKIEEYSQYLFIIFHFQVYERTTRISTRKQWSVFIGDTFLITLHPAELKTIDDMFRECELSEETRQEYLSRGSGYLLYQILDRLSDSYFPVLDKIASSLSNIEDSVFSEETEAAQELSTLRRDIITQRQVMFPTQLLPRRHVGPCSASGPAQSPGAGRWPLHV
jgi:magnesium transporter